MIALQPCTSAATKNLINTPIVVQTEQKKRKHTTEPTKKNKERKQEDIISWSEDNLSELEIEFGIAFKELNEQAEKIKNKK